MSSPEDLARELKDVNDLIAAQVSAGMCRDDVMQTVFNSWASRLGSCAKFTPKAKTLLTEAVQNGPWDADQMKDLARIILGGSGPGKKTNNRRPNQQAHKFENLIRMDTMAKLRSPRNYSRTSRMSIIAAEARLLGIECPDQPTLYRMVSILAWGEGSDINFSQSDVHVAMDSIQTFIKSVPRNKDIEYMQFYAATSELMPEAIKKAAWPDGNLPAELNIPELDTILGLAKMRGRPSAGTKKQKVPEWLAEVPEDRRDAVLAALHCQSSSGSNTAKPATQPVSTGTGYTAPAAAPIADVFRFQAPAPSKAASTAQVVDDKRPADADGEDEHEYEDEDDDDEKEPDLDHFEQQLVAAVKARRAKAKAAAKTAKAKAVPVLKRPAAATLLKRPAAATKAAAKKPASTKDVPKSSRWKLLHSKIYAATRKKEFEKHGNDELAKKRASEACAKKKPLFFRGELVY